MLYEKPNMEIMELKSEDVICTSVYDGTENNTSVSGSWVPPTN